MNRDRKSRRREELLNSVKRGTVLKFGSVNNRSHSDIISLSLPLKAKAIDHYAMDNRWA